MRMRKLAPRTKTGDICAVRRFTACLGRPLDTATAEVLCNFQLYLVDQGTTPATLNATISGLTFFSDVTLGRPELMTKMQLVHTPRTLRVILAEKRWHT